MGRPNEVQLGIYCTQILTSEDDIVAIPGQQLDVAGYMNQDSRHGFLLANRKFWVNGKCNYDVLVLLF